MNNKNLRIIKTARTKAAINEAIISGFKPIVKPVIASTEIKSKFAVLKEKSTGLIEVIHDYRSDGYSFLPDTESSHEVLIPFTYYYPHKFESPFAAYLVPSDIEINEVVWLSDLIEDVVASRWNQGDTYRLQSSEATWNGKEFILFKRASYRTEIVG